MPGYDLSTGLGYRMLVVVQRLAFLFMGMFVALACGCGPAIDVQIDAQRDADVPLESMGRFAVAHSPAAPQRGRVLTRRVADAFARHLSNNGWLAERDQKALVTAVERNALLREASDEARRAFQQRGFELDAADPQFVVSLDYAGGPVSYRIPPMVGDEEKGGRRVTQYAHAVAVYVYDVRQPHRPVWVGSAVTICSYGDTRVMGYLMEELTGLYPQPSNGIQWRTVGLD